MRPLLNRPDPYWRKHLLPGERAIVAVRQHWVKLLEPICTTFAMLILALVVDSNTSPRTAIVANICWIVFWCALARTLWFWAEWRHDTFVATDKRLLLSYGLITRRVAMMPLPKVTDMSYNRSPLGQLLGYGQFVLESAGQEQALRQIDYVPRPDRTYRQICQEIFGSSDPDDLSAPEPAPGAGSGPDEPHGDRATEGSAVQPTGRYASQPGARSVVRPGARRAEGETGTIYRSGEFDDDGTTRPIPISEWPGQRRRAKPDQPGEPGEPGQTEQD